MGGTEGTLREKNGKRRDRNGRGKRGAVNV